MKLEHKGTSALTRAQKLEFLARKSALPLLADRGRGRPTCEDNE